MKAWQIMDLEGTTSPAPAPGAGFRRNGARLRIDPLEGAASVLRGGAAGGVDADRSDLSGRSLRP